jgi:capsular exopolysaccharide synthesis family protein
MNRTIPPDTDRNAFAENEPGLIHAPENGSEHEGAFDVMRFLQILYLHKWLFLAGLLFCILISFFYALNQPKVYISKCEVFYNESLKEFVVESNVPVIKSDFDKDYWLSLMKSDQLAKLIRQNSGLPYSTAIIKRMIKVEATGKKDAPIPVYELTVTSKRADIVPIIIHSFVESLNDLLLQNQMISSAKLVSFLTKQLGDNNAKLSRIDQTILRSGAGANKAALHDVNKLASDLESFRNDLLNTQINLFSAMASRKRTQEELKSLDGTIVNESAFSEPLKVQLMNLQVDLARALTKNKEDHPIIKGIRDNIAQINKMLRDSIQQKLEIKSLIQNPLKSQLLSKLVDFQIQEISLQTRTESLQHVIAEFEAKMRPDSTDENQQQMLRNRELVFMSINLLNSKLIEAQSVAQGSLSRFVIIDEPEMPTSPSSMGFLYIMLLGIVAGLFIGGAAVFIYDMLDNRIIMVSDYEKFFKVPVMGVISHKRSSLSFDNPDIHPSSYERMNEFSEIVERIKQDLRDTDKKVFSLCSPLRKEGKTSLCLQIAVSLAEKGKNVLLVDVDMYLPKLSLQLMEKDRPNLLNYISGETDVNSVIHLSGYDNLWFTGIDKLPNNDKLSYDNPRFESFIAAVRNRFDVILFDTPAALYIPDTASILDKMDGIIVVVRLMFTTRKALEKMLKMLLVFKCKISGTIINDLKINKLTRYSDYHHYGYDYGYAYDTAGKKVKTRKKTIKQMIKSQVA